MQALGDLAYWRDAHGKGGDMISDDKMDVHRLVEGVFWTQFASKTVGGLLYKGHRE